MGCPLGRPFSASIRLALLAACSAPLVPHALLCLQASGCPSRARLHRQALSVWMCPPGPSALDLLLLSCLRLRYLARRPAPLVAPQAAACSGLKELSSPAWSAGTDRRLALARARPAALLSTGFSCLCLALQVLRPLPCPLAGFHLSLFAQPAWLCPCQVHAKGCPRRVVLVA